MAASGAAAFGAPTENVWSQIGRLTERGDWEDLGWNADLPRDLRLLFRAFVDEDHEEQDTRLLAIPWIQQAIQNLRDDDAKWNAHGARIFLKAAGELAAPQLELAMVVGDDQQRMVATHLLMACANVSDPAVLAEKYVLNMQDEGGGWLVMTGTDAFNVLASSDTLLKMAVPSLIKALDAKDPQLRINAAQLLCVAGCEDHADRLVAMLAPLLDHDDDAGTAGSAMSALGLLGTAAAEPLRSLRHDRDDQGRDLTDHLLWVVAGPMTEHAHEIPYWGGRYQRGMRTITQVSRDPARDPWKMRFLGCSAEWDGITTAHSTVRGDGGTFSFPRCPTALRQAHTVEDAAAAGTIIARRCLRGATERMARMRLEHLLAPLDRWSKRWAEPYLREAFERELAEQGVAPWDPAPFDAGFAATPGG